MEYNEELLEKIRELSYAKKIEIIIEKELLQEFELDNLIYNSDITLKEIEEII